MYTQALLCHRIHKGNSVKGEVYASSFWKRLCLFIATQRETWVGKRSSKFKKNKATSERKLTFYLSCFWGLLGLKRGIGKGVGKKRNRLCFSFFTPCWRGLAHLPCKEMPLGKSSCWCWRRMLLAYTPITWRLPQRWEYTSSGELWELEEGFFP